MNDRINELAEQAGFENGHQDCNGNSLSCELEKFAELIVNESNASTNFHKERAECDELIASAIKE